MPDTPVDLSHLDYCRCPAKEKAAFFGHYRLTGKIVLFRDNVASVDYCAKGGWLAAYCM